MKLMNKVNKWLKNKKVSNQSGQGMTEYILLVVVILAVAGIFKDQIIGAVRGKMNTVSGKINDFDERE